MSFKRAGDDHCALRLQKKQRVAELFAEDIPSNEVNKTRSGKYICLVCPHNPVLDTMPMLSIHRQGKRHQANMSIKIEKEYNLHELDEKNKQELYLRDATTNNKLSKTEHITLKSVSYKGSEITPPLLVKTRQLTESVTRVSNLQEINYGRTGLGKKRTDTHEEIRNEQVVSPCKRKKPFFQSRVKMKVDVQKSTFDDSNCNKVDKRLNLEAVMSSVRNGVNTGSRSFLASARKDNVKFHSSGSGAVSSFPSSVVANCSQADGYSNTCTDRRSIGTDGIGFEKTTELKSIGSKIMNKEQQKKYLQLKMSGWMLNSDGQWVKDENVEFDSDEEEPDNPHCW